MEVEMYHDLIVDGTSLKGYKVYINGKEAYNSAERDVEMIEIPGRDGAFSLDHGRFKNIAVSYDSGTFADNQTDFAENISDLRNFLASKRGYVRIEDDYNPDEYRMGVFQRGLEFDPIHYNMASEFPIEFNCKPQRFLKSGETPVSVASGDTITNPTLFDAHPLVKFQASGSGSITIGDKVVQFYNAPLGTISLPYTVQTLEYPIDTVDVVSFSGSYNTGDKFRVKGSKATFYLTAPNEIIAVEHPINETIIYRPAESKTLGTSSVQTFEDYIETEFTFGTASTVSKSATADYIMGSVRNTLTFHLDIIYDGDNTIRMKWYVDLAGGITRNRITTNSQYTITCDSTANSLTGDLYMDLDIGEAYRIEDGNVVSINNFTNLGGELPTLPPGSTTITYSNTISNVEIAPRYWRV
jgi:phage-related protein